MSETPAQFGRYRVISELGRGAMGVVYKAQDSLLDRTVAIKTILLSAETDERGEYEARFFQEAKAAGGLNHPNIITIHDIGREGDTAYMAMEFLEGVDLRQLLAQGQPPLPDALDFAIQVADGLAFAHEQGIVHRDIKPANIMIVRETHAKITDFGIARRRLSDLKTRTGAVVGSPKYMSPEQVAGARADQRSDLFSLGVTVYEMVTGVAPFSGPELTKLLYEISTTAPRPPSSVNAALPSMLDLIVLKALAKTPEERYQTAYEFAADLRACVAELGDHASAAAPLATTAHVPSQRTPVGEGTKTLKLSATLAAAPALQLTLSRRFDSAAALRGLQELATAQRKAGGRKALELTRWLLDPYLKRLAVTAMAAITLALGIAFL